jgi:hypothetical protein
MLPVIEKNGTHVHQKIGPSSNRVRSMSSAMLSGSLFENCKICFFFSVPSLQAMCRVAILERIDKKAVTMLPLPNPLKQYLTYNGYDDYVGDDEEY